MFIYNPLNLLVFVKKKLTYSVELKNSKIIFAKWNS